MSDAYERVKGGRLTFKGGILGTPSKDIDKKKKKKRNEYNFSEDNDVVALPEDPNEAPGSNYGSNSSAGEIYTINDAKMMKYEDLSPVEVKKFRYDPLAKTKSVEEALEDHVKKKADRYCK